MTDDLRERSDELLRQKLRRIISDFFRDKPPGTILEEHDLSAYRGRLRETVVEHRRRLLKTVAERQRLRREEP